MVINKKGQSVTEFLTVTLLLVIMGIFIDVLVRNHLIPAPFFATQKIGQDK